MNENFEQYIEYYKEFRLSVLSPHEAMLKAHELMIFRSH
jgi:hypothetical protein